MFLLSILYFIFVQNFKLYFFLKIILRNFQIKNYITNYIYYIIY